MKKYLRPTLLFLLVILILAQFYRPARNQSEAQKNAMASLYPMSAAVESSFKSACFDCHSNYTRYPWYAEVQPVRWWLDGHVKNGKRHLNFSTFGDNDASSQKHKIEEIIEVLEEGQMPLRSYTWMHPEAKLSEAQQSELISWARQQLSN